MLLTTHACFKAIGVKFLVCLASGVITFLLGVAPANAQTIDVLVVYTPKVERSLGANGAKALAINSINSLNGILLKSGINTVKYRLAGNQSRRVNSYTEAAKDMKLDLERLSNPDDLYMDEVHDWRKETRADLVHLLRFGPAGNVAGIAYLSVGWDANTSKPQGSSSAGFAVSAHDAAVAGFTFAHEVGHNMGVYHAREDSKDDVDNPRARDFWFGYRFKSSNGTQFRTVMAYSPGTRIPHFSNPDVKYSVSGDKFYPTGVKSTGGPVPLTKMPPESDVPTGPANSAKAIVDNAAFVARYESGPEPPPGGTKISVVGDFRFPSLMLGRSSVKNISVQNRGSQPITLDKITLPDPAFTTDWKGGIIKGRGAVRISVTFKPVEEKEIIGQISILVGGVSQATVECRGEGRVTPPRTR